MLSCIDCKQSISGLFFKYSHGPVCTECGSKRDVIAFELAVRRAQWFEAKQRDYEDILPPGIWPKPELSCAAVSGSCTLTTD